VLPQKEQCFQRKLWFKFLVRGYQHSASVHQQKQYLVCLAQERIGEKKMIDEKNKQRIGIPVVIPWVLTLITAIGGIWQFTQQQRQANQEPFLKKQLELSFDTSDTVARLGGLSR
jgi:hypothetical protein